MSLARVIVQALAQRFGPEWSALKDAQKTLVMRDFAELLRDEYDTPDDTMSDGIAEDNALEASREYRRRIGGGNLASYVKCLEAHNIETRSLSTCNQGGANGTFSRRSSW